MFYKIKLKKLIILFKIILNCDIIKIVRKVTKIKKNINSKDLYNIIQ